MEQYARRLMAALIVCACSWKRYSGQISSVPPAKSIRVGADDSMSTHDDKAAKGQFQTPNALSENRKSEIKDQNPHASWLSRHSRA